MNRSDNVFRTLRTRAHELDTAMRSLGAARVTHLPLPSLAAPTTLEEITAALRELADNLFSDAGLAEPWIAAKRGPLPAEHVTAAHELLYRWYQLLSSAASELDKSRLQFCDFYDRVVAFNRARRYFLCTAVADNALVGIDGEQWPAYDSGARWNGFVCPTFTRVTAELIVEHINRVNAESSDPDAQHYLSWKGDMLLITCPLDAADDPSYQPIPVFPDRHGRYAIGAYRWCWQRTDGDDHPDPRHV